MLRTSPRLHGLFIPHGIAGEFRRELEVKSAEGKGSVFRVPMRIEKE